MHLAIPLPIRPINPFHGWDPKTTDEANKSKRTILFLSSFCLGQLLGVGGQLSAPNAALACTGCTQTGAGAVASGDYSTATGANATASAGNATATGQAATASGSNSSAQGQNAKATGAASTASGSNAIAAANFATANGAGAQANGV